MITLNTGERLGNLRALNVTIRMKRLMGGVALAVALCGTAVIGQTVTTQRLFVVETVTPAVQSQFQQRGAVKSYIVNQGTFDPDNNGLFEHSRPFIETFTNQVPFHYAGPVCLDWEGQGMARLLAPIGSQMQLQTMKAYVELLTLAQELRPNAQIGFYNLPMSEYWHRNQAWRDRNLSLAPIIDASDCLFPSVYDYYRTGQSAGHSPEFDLQYVRESVLMALEMAHGKPVYPYVTPRCHPSNYHYGLRLIPVDEFKSHVRAAFDPDYRGDRADGLVWWGADRYYRWLGQQNYPPPHPQFWMSYVCRTVFATEIPPNVTDDAHFTNIHRRTLRQLSEVINDAF